MRAFSELYQRLDETTRTGVKVRVMSRYFEEVDPRDGAWAVFFLCGRRLKRLVPARQLREWAAELAGLPNWLFEECYESVGDLAETIAALVPDGDAFQSPPLHEVVTQQLQPLSTLDDTNRQISLVESWQQMDRHQRFVFNKLLTGGFRVGVSQKLVVRALAAASDLDVSVVAHRLMGHWDPTADFFENLRAPDDGTSDISRPYPFCLAHPLHKDPAELGSVEDWLIDWKWDGIRAQLIRREQQTWLWSRGEELVNEQFPEIIDLAEGLPDGTVLDGEIVAWRDGHILSFGELQRRIGTRRLGRKLLSEVPVRLIAFDLLESSGIDLRCVSMLERRRQLEHLHQNLALPEALQISPTLSVSSWDELAECRETSRDRGVEGVMLKRHDADYSVGRVTGNWWKWKVDPFSIDAVLIYAQRGHGRRASLYSDYTFAVWDDSDLVPFAKAYSGLTDAEIKEVDRFIRRNTVERFGPVRSVKPELVFELAFEGIQISRRHRSGVAVRFPRMVRPRPDKRIEEADTLQSIRDLLPRQPEATR